MNIIFCNNFRNGDIHYSREYVKDIIKKTNANNYYAINEDRTNKNVVDLPDDLIETDNIGEVIEKLAILHCRMWYLEDAMADAKTDKEMADLKRKIDICFKQKRPKYVQAINRMIDNTIINDKSLIEDSVKIYKGYKE